MSIEGLQLLRIQSRVLVARGTHDPRCVPFPMFIFTISGTVYDGVALVHHTKIHTPACKLTICSSLLCECITQLFKEATPASFPGSLL